ncbi:MAG: rhodanese-like domain-containing protein [Bacteroidales bacterium]|nr:rhodanese-like domain-containing protein [Bacteroidales bacterium]
MKRIIIILIVIVIVAAGVTAIIYFSKMNSNFTTLNANDFEKAIANENTIIVDVRTADEYSGGHIPNAINIDVKRAGFLYEADEKLPKDKTIAVYCQGGVRSRKAATLLSDNGYNVINLAGGISEWNGAGKETEQ